MPRPHYLIFLAILNAFLLLMSSCMQFRTGFSKAEQEFKSEGLTLHDVNQQHGERTHHAVWTGDSLKPTLLFIHGSPGSWTAFEDYLKDSTLLASYRLISVDRPGFGYSNFGKPVASLAEQAEAVRHVMDSLDNGRAYYLIGHSLGGPVAVELAGMDTARVKGIALLSASIDPELEPREIFRPWLLPRWVSYVMPRSFWASNYEIYYLMAELEKQKQVWPKLRCKVLVIHGEKDKMVPVGNAAYAEKMYPKTGSYRQVILKGKNHFIPWTAMDTVRQELRLFAGDGR